MGGFQNHRLARAEQPLARREDRRSETPVKAWFSREKRGVTTFGRLMAGPVAA